MKSLIIVVVVTAFALLFVVVGSALRVIDKNQNSELCSVTTVSIYVPAGRIMGTAHNTDDAGGHLDYKVSNWEGYKRVVFVDRFFDGTLDEVRTLRKAGDDEVVIRRPEDDHPNVEWAQWELRFAVMRAKLSAPAGHAVIANPLATTAPAK